MDIWNSLGFLIIFLDEKMVLRLDFLKSPYLSDTHTDLLYIKKYDVWDLLQNNLKGTLWMGYIDDWPWAYEFWS